MHHARGAVIPLIMIPRAWSHPSICFHCHETHSLIPIVAHLAGAEYLLALPARLRLQRLTCDTLDALLAPHAGRKCNVAALLAHMMTPAEGDADAALQLMLALLRSARLDTLSDLCRAMMEAGCGAQIASLLVEAMRCGICPMVCWVLAGVLVPYCSAAPL